MKIRTGFVSNSSSSSFVCDACDETFSGWDAAPDEFDHFECVNGHIFCDEFLVGELPESEDEDEDGYWDGLPVEYCPVCQFKVGCSSKLAIYLEKKSKSTRAEVFAKIKEENKRRKKLYDHEYVDYVYTKLGLNKKNILVEIRERFKNHDAFSKHLGSKS